MNLPSRGCRWRGIRRRAGWLWLWNRLRGGRLAAGKAGWSIAIGLFVGSLPLFGLHLPLCILLCWPLRLDVLLAYAAAHVSNPLVAPALLALEYTVGGLILHGTQGPFGLEGLEALGLGGVLSQAALGATVVGATLAAAGGTATTWLVRAMQTRTRPEPAALLLTQRRYRKLPRPERFYVATKLRFDPIFPALSSFQSNLGRVLDAGCGRGQLSLFLYDLGATQNVQGFDADPRKVATAQTAAGPHGQYWTQSLGEARPWPAADTILLVDVLHYLNDTEQQRVLDSAAAALAPGGRLVLRELDADRRRNPLGRIAEVMGCRLGMNHSGELHFISRSALERNLKERGFHCTSPAGLKSSMLANFLLVAVREPNNELSGQDQRRASQHFPIKSLP